MQIKPEKNVKFIVRGGSIKKVAMKNYIEECEGNMMKELLTGPQNWSGN